MEDFKMDEGTNAIVALVMFALFMIPYVIVGLVETGCF